MKRLLSIVLIVIVAILSLTVSSGAKELNPTSYKYQANFNRFLYGDYADEPGFVPDYEIYEEVYYHYAQDGTPYTMLKKDHFYDLVDRDYLVPTDVFDRFDGLYEVWQTLDLSEMSPEVILGDANGDHSMDIVDATYIQRYLVSMVSKYDIVETAADVDGDGDVTVIDTTHIQRALVGFCHLDGTPC